MSCAIPQLTEVIPASEERRINHPPSRYTAMSLRPSPSKSTTVLLAEAVVHPKSSNSFSVSARLWLGPAKKGSINSFVLRAVSKGETDEPVCWGLGAYI